MHAILASELTPPAAPLVVDGATYREGGRITTIPNGPHRRAHDQVCIET